MPPKKKEGDGKDDNDGDIQSLLLEKDLEIETLIDKISRLEKRSESLANFMERQQATTEEMEEKLQDVITCLSSELKTKESKVYQLEESFKDLKAENIKAIETFTKDMHQLQNNHKFVTEDLRLQLANAEVQLRDIDDFREQKTTIEQEIASLKEQLEREKKEHQDAISDTERSALQDKQRLRKEMLARIEETKMQMLQHMDEQLHAVEDELARRNLMNQKTIRILLYKFQEGLHADKPDDQEMKSLVSEHKQAEYCKNKELEQIKSYIEEQTRAVESVSSAEEAMRFLYACLDDIDLENVGGTQEEQVDSGCEIDSRRNVEGPPSSLDQFTSLQRQELLMHLLRTAVSLRAVAQNPALQRPPGDLFSMANGSSLFAEGRGAVSVEDILSLSVEDTHLDKFHCGSGSTRRLVSVGVQTEAMVHTSSRFLLGDEGTVTWNGNRDVEGKMGMMATICNSKCFEGRKFVERCPSQGHGIEFHVTMGEEHVCFMWWAQVAGKVKNNIIERPLCSILQEFGGKVSLRHQGEAATVQFVRGHDMKAEMYSIQSL